MFKADEVYDLKLSRNGILALQSVFLKCLVEGENIQDVLEALRFHCTYASPTVKTIDISNPPRSISFDKLDNMEETEEVQEEGETDE